MATMNTVAEIQAAQLLSNYRLTPATLFHKLDPTWIPAKWLQYLSLKIAQAVSRGNCGLLISAPPRHGKSRLITTATPIWALENFPDKNVIVSTYGSDLSTDFSREIRDFITERPDVLSVRLRGDSKRVDNFLTTQGGGLKAVGLGGAITGRGAHVFILDDYIKEPKEAQSHAYLEGLWTWYQTVARTRLEPGAVVIIVATRWVENDIHGRIEHLQKMTGRNFFEIIKIPALAGENDFLGRKPGETLFPERYTKEAIEAIKTDVGSRWFEAMFQQNPLGDENAAVQLDWFKHITQEAFDPIRAAAQADVNRFKWVRYWDFASTKNAGDYTSGPKCLYDTLTENFYITEMVRKQYSAQQAEAAFESAFINDQQQSPNHRVGMEKEPGSSGDYAVRHFQKIAREAKDHLGMKLAPDKILHSFRATTSKLLNAQPFLAAAEAGHVYYLDGHWNTDWLNELKQFPEGAHDDQVDAVSGAYKLITGKKTLSAVFGRSPQVEQLISQKSASTPETKRRSSVTFGRNYVPIHLR